MPIVTLQDLVAVVGAERAHRPGYCISDRLVVRDAGNQAFFSRQRKQKCVVAYAGLFVDCVHAVFL